MTEQTARSKLKEWFDANGAEIRRATTAYEQRTLQDFADWLDAQQTAELSALHARIASLEAAVGFYADHRRYEGPNQSPIDGDPFQPEDMTSYIWDVHRDGGEIARKALAARAAQQPPAQG
jgi:hypothetical protein